MVRTVSRQALPARCDFATVNLKVERGFALVVCDCKLYASRFALEKEGTECECSYLFRV